MRLIAFTAVLAMMLGPVGILDKSAGYVTNEARAEENEVTDDAAAQVADEEDIRQGEAETEPEPDNTVITEADTPSDVRMEEYPEDDEDDEDEEEYEDNDFDDFDDDEFEEFDDDEVGSVSENLLQQFNNPDSFESVEFNGSADIELKSDAWDDDWDGKVTLVARVQDPTLSYRLVWEANDHDSRGWFTVGSGSEYSYTLTRDNLEREANREYRVVMFTVD